MKIQRQKLFQQYEKYKHYKAVALLLKAASFFFLLGVNLRKLLYNQGILKTHSLNAHVVSIGNITSGGTGKTPLTIECAKYYISLGHEVAIICRGYTGNIEKGTVLVSDGEEILSDYEEAGEEAILIAKKVPRAIVIAGKDRISCGNAAIKLGAEVLILDDGFQYLKLHRNNNILLINSYDPFSSNKILPEGLLREGISSIKRADSIVLTNSDKVNISDNDLQSISRNKSQSANTLKIISRITGLRSLNTKVEKDLSEVKKMEAIIFCGIGSPQSFTDSLKRIEINVLAHIYYPDHHRYSYDDIKQVSKLANMYKTNNIITTEKDAVKVKELVQASEESYWEAKHEINWSTDNFFEKLLPNSIKRKS